MASIASLTASPTTVAKGGGTTKITPAITGLDVIASITVTLDSPTGGAPVTVDIHEALTFSVNPADVGKPGFVVATVDQGGTLTVGADGASFTFTAS